MGIFMLDDLKKARLPHVKMIELKLSQGAKPGHGGMPLRLKNTGNCKIRGKYRRNRLRT